MREEDIVEGVDNVYIRVINAKYHIDRRDKRLSSLAFGGKNGAFSVFCEQCAISTSGTVCKHIASFYERVASVPAVFCRLSRHEFPPHVSVRQVTEEGDKCHHNIESLTKKEVRSLALRYSLETLQICREGGEHCGVSSGDLLLLLDSIPMLE